MKIFLFQFYSPYACPDYDEIGNLLRHKGHKVSVTHMTQERKLRVIDDRSETDFDIFPRKIIDTGYFKFIFRRFAFILFMLRVRRIIRKLNPDIFMIAPAELMYLSLLPLLMPKTIKFVFDIRQLGLTPGNSLKSTLRNVRLKFNYVFLSRYLYDHTCFAFEDAAIKILGTEWKEKKASVMEVGVNQIFFNIQHTQIIRNDRKLELIYVGSLSKLRKLEVIMDAVNLISIHSGEFHITFIGYDPDNYYSTYVNKNNLKKFITILEPVPYKEIPSIVSNYDVAIAYVPDHPDWLYQPTLKVKEYCAIGIPVIASENRPNRAFVKENKNGVFFSNSAEDICRAVVLLLNNKDLLNKLSEFSQNNRHGSTWDDSVLNYEKLFHEL